MSSEAALKLLSVETRAKLRSSQLLTSLPQVVSELLQNSLDAGASQINIGVNYEEWSCWVRDDGAGFSKGDLTIIGKGSEEGRYSTSKAYALASPGSVSTFGFRGEALSSMAELCCLEISSRTSTSRESWSVILKGGKSLYSGPSIRWRRESAGTVVCVRDAFFSLPIRRQSHSSPAKTIDTIRQELEAYAVIFPGVSFTLQDDSKSRESDTNKGHVLRVPKTSSILAAFRHMYGRALTQHVEEVNSALGDLKVEGFISLVGARSKNYQYLYINKHPISFCDLHRLIESKFSGSTFIKHAYDEGGETSLRSSARRSPRKCEKRPIFVLNLVIPTRHIDNCLEPAKSAVHLEHKNVVTSFLSSVIDGFLARHGFASDKRRFEGDREFPTKKRKLNAQSTAPNTAKNIILTPARQRSEDPTLFIRPEEIPEEVPQANIWQDPATNETFIVDPRSANSCPQNSRHKINEDNTASMSRVSRITSFLRKGTDSGQGACSGPTGDGMPDWLLEALGANKAFAVTEPKIPSLPPVPNQATDGQNYTSIHSPNYSCYAHTFGMPYLQPGSSSEHPRIRFQKADLLKAQIISQVDRKFIACLVDLDHSTDRENEILLDKHPADNSTLLLIDQHAADERVRVERFLKEICSGFLRHCEGTGSVEVLELSPAIPILLTHHEASRLASVEEVQLAFGRWGVKFEGLAKLTSLESESANEAGDGYVQVFVQAIPAILGDKLLLNDELQDLVQGYLGTLESKEVSPPNLSQQRDDNSVSVRHDEPESQWLKALRWCPRELLDLINSKACRGAVMFNDPLSMEQCERLVGHLAATAFPFQCAHGRPSLIPLTYVSTKGVGWTAPALDWVRLSES